MFVHCVSAAGDSSMMLLWVIVSPQEIRRVTLQDVPHRLMNCVQCYAIVLASGGTSFYNLKIQTFGISSVTWQIVRTYHQNEPLSKFCFVHTCSSEVASDSALDNTRISSPTSCDSAEWLDPFVIPAFSHDIEVQLRAATVMVILKGVKSEIVDRLVDIISKITVYPGKDHYETEHWTLFLQIVGVSEVFSLYNTSQLWTKQVKKRVWIKSWSTCTLFWSVGLVVKMSTNLCWGTHHLKQF